MKHFQYSVMGLEILLKSLGWVTKISVEISFPPPAHPSSCFMTGPLYVSIHFLIFLIQNVFYFPALLIPVLRREMEYSP